ncbi:EF-hand domain-containing protein [Parasphingorhabdus pacifica]
MTNVTAQNRVKQRFDRWDANGNGTLERSDMEEEAANIAAAFGKSPSSPETQNIKAAFRGLFELVAEQSGVSPEESVSEEQFRLVAESLIFEQGEATFNRALSPIIEGIVGLCDKNADGKVNREEFATWLSAVGLSHEEGQEAFGKIDKNGNGVLTRDELLEAVRDYHFGRLDIELIAV